MVASSNGDLYSPFRPTMISEDGPQSSEEGSGLHSPAFEQSYASTHGDSFRYHNQLDVQQAASVLGSQFDYAQGLAPQQGPISVSALDLPGSSARHASYTNAQFLPHTTQPTHHSSRNQLGLDFPSDARLPPAIQTVSSPDWYGPISERRLPDGRSQEHAFPRTGTSPVVPISTDHRAQPMVSTERSELSNTLSATSPARDERKAASSVVIACRQCRSRKIRCDSTRPVCNNCVRRNNQCEYDSVPKRRGPDKRPGTRQRSCKKRPADGSVPPPPKRKKTSDRTPDVHSAQSRIKENMSEPSRSPLSRHSDRPQDNYQFAHPGVAPTTDLRISTDTNALLSDPSPVYRRYPAYGYEQGSFTKQSFPRQLDVNTFQSLEPSQRHFAQQKSAVVEAEHKVLWNRILEDRHIPDILQEINFLVEGTGRMLSFVNMAYLEKRIWSDEQRLSIHPAFIFAALAMARLMRSSSFEDGRQGLQEALNLRNEALKALRHSMSLAWADVSLVEAALILAIFESSAQPDFSHSNAASALMELDGLIRQLNLTAHDRHEPNVSRYSGVPVIYCPPMDRDAPPRRCSCIGTLTSPMDDSYGTRQYIPPWDPTWTVEQIRGEEIRRLCWSALDLVSEFLAQCATDNRPMPRFHLSDPSKYFLLFPGETIHQIQPLYNSSEPLTAKESVWALYCRSMLLWNYCNRFREETPDDENRAEDVWEAWTEIQSIEDSLDVHKCNLDTSLIYTTREHVHNIRMLVTQALRSLQGYDRGPKFTPGPVFKRQQAEDWIYYQDQVVRRVVSTINNLNSPDGVQLTQRPFRVQWFIYQLTVCLRLWSHDRTLDDALKLGKRLLQVVEVMNSLWECPTNQSECAELRRQLTEACKVVGMEEPFPAAYNIPSSILHP